MIKLEGTVINTFHIEAGKKKNGDEYDAADKVQLLGSLELPNGQIKNELIDLKVEDASIYEAFKNKLISISCGAFPAGKNVVFYVRKGAKPVLAEAI
jgi:hypothetical protein